MVDWPSLFHRPVIAKARRVANWPLLRPAAVAGYGLLAREVAQRLARVRAAEAVYLAGSLLAPRSVVPGISDIDLLVVADLPNVDAELAFRADLTELWRRVTSVFPVFYNLDYVDRADAPFLSALGQTWISDFEKRFRLLAGTPLPSFDFERPPQERAIERLIHALSKWRKSGCHLIDPRLEVEPWITTRAAERLLALVLAHRRGLSIEAPLDELLAESAPSSRLPEVKLAGARQRVVACLATALEVLEAFANECTAAWSSSWRLSASGTAPEPTPAEWGEARVLASHGFASVYVVPNGPSARAHRVIAVGAEGESAGAVLERASRAFCDLPAATPENRFPSRPVILTRSLWRATALIEPCPFIAAHIASGRCAVLGEPLPPPPAPPDEALEAILRTRAVELFVRPRTRLLRVGKASARRRLADDLRLAPVLTTALETGILELDGGDAGAFPSPDSSERIVLEALRRWVLVRRQGFAAELVAREAGETASSAGASSAFVSPVTPRNR